MGTRALVYIKETEKAKPFICIYRQCDGYQEGLGKDLVDLLKGYKIVNGFGGDDMTCCVCNKREYEHPGKHSLQDAKADHPFSPKRVANGISCLAATIIKGLKNGLGNVYLYPPTTKDAGQEYEYSLWVEKHDILMLRVGTPEYKNCGIPAKVLYSGPLDSYDPTAKEDE